MSGYIKLYPHHTGDARWIEAGADAFMINAWALVWCNEQLSDGRIPKVTAERIALPVPPSRVEPALALLVKTGLWHEDGDDYVIVDYDEHALPADEIRSTRARWAGDKRWRRKHNVGNHDECPPSKCRAAAASQRDTGECPSETNAMSRPLDQTRTDQTRRGASGSGSGSRTRRHASSADAPHAVTRVPLVWVENRDPEPEHPTPFDIGIVQRQATTTLVEVMVGRLVDVRSLTGVGAIVGNDEGLAFFRHHAEAISEWLAKVAAAERERIDGPNADWCVARTSLTHWRPHLSVIVGRDRADKVSSDLARLWRDRIAVVWPESIDDAATSEAGTMEFVRTTPADTVREPADV